MADVGLMFEGGREVQQFAALMLRRDRIPSGGPHLFSYTVLLSQTHMTETYAQYIRIKLMNRNMSYG